MFTRKIKRILTIMLALALGLSPAALAERYTVYAAKDGAKVYDGEGEVIGKLQEGTALTLTGVKGQVCRVEKDGRTGYMKKDDLCAAPDCDPAESAQSVKAYVCKDGATVYTAKGKAAGTLPLNAAVTVTAVKDDVCRVEKDGKTGYMKKGDLSASKTEAAREESASTASASKLPSGSVKEMDWWTSDIQTIFARGVTAQITDVETGLSWYEKRMGGTNHADCQPLTAADTAALKQAYGGTWSWNRRAIIVTINGVNYAASMNGMPHGSGSISDNDFNGHHCIHFTNSRTHGSNKVCPLHQAAIKKAAAVTIP